MVSDMLLARLRDENRVARGNALGWEILDEAADEIEMLRVRIGLIKADFENYRRGLCNFEQLAEVIEAPVPYYREVSA